jgi:hypothetical protein
LLLKRMEPARVARRYRRAREDRAYGQECVGESEYCMWRAVFAFALADKILSLEKQDFLRCLRRRARFSPRQLALLRRDFADPPDVEEMYRRITRPEDKARFFTLADALARLKAHPHPLQEKACRTYLDTAQVRASSPHAVELRI